MRLVSDLSGGVLATLLSRFSLQLESVAQGIAIPGSYWGDDEAGLIGQALFVRASTPVHSALHEASHFICMDKSRRSQVDRDAGGDYAEENAVCYLQILLADHLNGMDRATMFADMDAWGYTFRLGSVRAWFEEDAEDAQKWLQLHGIVDSTNAVTGALRR